MDDAAEEEKSQLLASIRLQDAALSVTVDNSMVTLDSDSDINEEEDDTVPSGSDQIQTNVIEDGPTLSIVKSKEPSWADALEANQDYDGVLAQLETEIRLNLAKVTRQLDDVQSQITSESNLSSGLNMKSHWIYIFGMPYFKTSDFYHCPFNEDYHHKKRNNEICWSDLPPFRQWVGRHKKLLIQAVRLLSLQKCEEEAKLKLAILKKELEAAKKSRCKEKVAQLEKEVVKFDVKSLAQSMLDDVIQNGEHDWMQISAKYLEGKQSPETCRAFWYLYLHPSINKAPYTEKEEEKLVELAEKYQHQNWDHIAKELGTNRSGYQCFIIYQNKLNVSLTKKYWSHEEDKKLLKTVEMHRIGKYIPWGKVAYHMEGRTTTQLFNRWSYSVNPSIKKGRFTEEEDMMILVGVQMWGRDFQRISNFLMDRTTNQVRDRYRNYLTRKGAGIPWTIDDDQLLIRLVEKHGKAWAKIAERFPSKDRTQIRHRYATLLSWRAKNPDAPWSEAPCRVFNPSQDKHFQEKWEKAKAILQCGNLDEMVKAKNDFVTSAVRRKRASVLDQHKKKKPSIVETDLLNYFRCSYDLPGGEKIQTRPGQANEYANELAMLLNLLNAKLNLPSAEQLNQDPSLSSTDKDILTSFINIGTACEVVAEEPGRVDSNNVQIFSEECERPPPPLLFCDVQPTFAMPEVEEEAKISYIPKAGIDSSYIDLPLLSFSQDEVVCDRNRDPSFFLPRNVDPVVCSMNTSHPSSSGTKIEYAMPPNLATLVGLRTLLLNRRTLLLCSNADQDNITENCVVKSDELLSEAKKKFDERFLCFFLWPALMSRNGPSPGGSIFTDDENNGCDNKTKIDLSKIVRQPKIASQVREVNLENEGVSETLQKPTLSSEPNLTSTKEDINSTGSLGPPEKRRKVIRKEDLDKDPGCQDSM